MLTARLIAAVMLLLMLAQSTAAPAHVQAALRSTPVQASSQAPTATYRLEATVDLSAATVSVTEAVQFRNVLGVSLDSLVFHVAANTLDVFTLAGITVDGEPVDPSLNGSVLEVGLPRALAPGERTMVELRYMLAVTSEPGRLTATSRGMTLGYWFPILAVHQGDWDRRQFVDVGDASFSEVADYDVTIVTTSPAQVVATGERQEQIGQRSRFTAMSVRDFAVAISPEFVVRRTMVDGTTLEVAAFGEDRARYYLARGPDFLRWANERFGPYPYPILVIADSDLPSAFGGLEYPGVVFLARGIPVVAQPVGGTLDALYLHEILHQWFYSLVGDDQFDEPWLDEAFVTYLTYRYYRETQPEAAQAVYDRTIAGGASGLVDGGVYDFPSDPVYFGAVYRGGARFLEALQAQLGDGAFWTLLREHVETYRDRIATGRAFLDRAQALSSAPLSPLIDDYFGYGAFRTATPRNWTLESPASPWSGSAALFVGADFPVSRVQVWLDQRQVANGSANALTLDLTDIDPGSYVLLVQVWDHDSVLFERARRIEVTR